MQSSRRTSAVAFFVCEACRAAFLMDVPTHWTMAHVLAFHFDTILRPFHMVRRRVRSSSSRQVLARLNASCGACLHDDRPSLHVSRLFVQYAAVLKSWYHSRFVRSIILAYTPTNSPTNLALPLGLWGEQVPDSAMVVQAGISLDTMVLCGMLESSRSVAAST